MTAARHVMPDIWFDFGVCPTTLFATTFDISPGGYAILAILLVNSNIMTLPVQPNIKLASVSK